MREAEIKKWNEEGEYYKLKQLELRRRKRCLICGIVSLISAMLWFPVLFMLIIWGMSKWGWIRPGPAWYNILLSIAFILPAVVSIVILLYIWLGLLSGRKSWSIMEKAGLILSIISTVFHLAAWVMIAAVG